MTDLDTLKNKWTIATADLPYGVQRVFHDVFTLVAEGKKTNLVYGSDYSGDTGVCLVNAAGHMLTTGGGHGIPSATFGTIVGLFDNINRVLQAKGVNKDNYVSPFAAEIFLEWFAPLKEAPIATQVDEATANESFATDVYVEPTDEEMARSLMDMMSADSGNTNPMAKWSAQDAMKANKVADQILFGK